MLLVLLCFLCCGTECIKIVLKNYERINNGVIGQRICKQNMDTGQNLNSYQIKFLVWVNHERKFQNSWGCFRQNLRQISSTKIPGFSLFLLSKFKPSTNLIFVPFSISFNFTSLKLCLKFPHPCPNLKSITKPISTNLPMSDSMAFPPCPSAT